MPYLDLSYIITAQARKHVTYNGPIGTLDCIIHLSLMEADISAPQRCLELHIPRIGWIALVAAGSTLYTLNGSVWLRPADSPFTRHCSSASAR